MGEKVIEVKNVRKRYKKRQSKEFVQAVDHISFSVEKGEILGLLGPNGAGKTTTIKMVCGLLVPDEGQIIVNGVDIGKNRLKALEHISAVLEGNRNLYWRLTVKENLQYFAGNRGVSVKQASGKIEKLLHQFHLKDKENELVNRLSRGMQQKLAIAVSMLADSDVILLDEPTLGLDVETSYEVRELLHDIVEKEGRTIIISSHDMDVIQDLCERTVIINHGKVVTDDKVENLLRLFDVRSYNIMLGEPLSEKQQHLMQQKFPMLTYKKENMQHIIHGELLKSEEIYDLFEVLKMENTIVEAIDRTTINFEQVFMKIVKEESANALA